MAGQSGVVFGNNFIRVVQPHFPIAPTAKAGKSFIIII